MIYLNEKVNFGLHLLFVKSFYRNQIFKDKVKVLHWGQFFIYFVLNYNISQSFLGFLFLTVINLIFFSISYKLIRSLFYSYWFTAFINYLYQFSIFLSLDFEEAHFSNFYLLLLVFSLQGLLTYFLISPIYYPLFKWWHYDLSKKKDLTTFLELNGETYEGRLLDIRSNQAAIIMFEDFSEDFQAKLNIKDRNDLFFDITIKNKRDAGLGRGYIYGVVFNEIKSNLVLNKYKKLKDLKVEVS